MSEKRCVSLHSACGILLGSSQSALTTILGDLSKEGGSYEGLDFSDAKGHVDFQKGETGVTVHGLSLELLLTLIEQDLIETDKGKPFALKAFAEKFGVDKEILGIEEVEKPEVTMKWSNPDVGQPKTIG